jgi:hypothetical protein
MNVKDAPADVLEGREVAAENGMVALIASAEIDQQIATAHKYPRSISSFRKEALAMVTLSEVIAQECIYALPRDGKVIQGPSARFAEIMLHAWGNTRAGARVVHEDHEFITSQGVCHDLQRNVAITFEVRRRITDKRGHRYSPDMIGVTANAASSIALRNSILKVVPKAFWSELYTAARLTAVGDVKTLANKRADAIAAFQHYGVSEAQILAKLGRGGIQDVTPDDLAALFGILTAIKDQEITPEEAFALEPGAAKPQSTEKPPYPPEDFAKNLPKWRDLIAKDKKTADEIIATVESKAALTEEQRAGIRGDNEPAPDEEVVAMFEKASAATISHDEIAKHLGITNEDHTLTRGEVRRALAFIANPGAAK